MRRRRKFGRNDGFAPIQRPAARISAEKKIAEIAKSDQISNGGLLATTINGNVIHSPLLGIANKAMSDMVRYAVELGMTPSARSRITANPPEEEEDKSAKYFK